MNHMPRLPRQQTKTLGSTPISGGLNTSSSKTSHTLHLQRLVGNRRTQQILDKAVQRQTADPFAHESSDDKTRRLRAIDATRASIEKLTTVIGGGYLYTFECLDSAGVDQSQAPLLISLADSPVYHESFEQREDRLRTLLGGLIHVLRRLESQPLPADELTPEGMATYWGRLTLYLVSDDDGYTIMRTMLAHAQRRQGQSFLEVLLNAETIKHEPVISRRVPRGRVGTGSSTGIWITVPDPENHPMTYQRVTTGPLGGGTILDVMHDDAGFYYVYKKKRHYMPERP